MRIAAAFLAAVLAVSPGSSAPGKTRASGVVNGCVSVKTRALTIPAGTGKCKTGTQSISWRASGPAGPAGTPGWGLTVPGTQSVHALDDVIFDGTHLWGTDEAHDTVVEVDPGGRTIMRTLSAQKYGFNLPTTLTSGGGDLWVLNSADNSVTELTTSDGSFVRRLSAARYGFSTAGKLAASGGHLWVSDPAANAVTEINASNGAILRRLTAARYGFSSPTALNFADGHLWVADRDNSSVTEVNPANGALVRRIEGLPSPAVLASSGDRLWVLCGNNQKRFGLAVEVNASSGAVVRRVDGARLDLGTAFSAAFAGGRLWFSDNNSTVEVNPSTGTFVRKIPIFVISDEIDTPGALTSDGQHLWMAAAFGLSEFPADGPDDTGPGILGCVATQSRALTIPAAGASCGHGSAEIGWLRNGPGGQPGAAGWPGVITGASYGFGAPNSVTAAGGRIWVTNASGNSVTEINPGDDSLVRRLAGNRYGFSAPVAGTANGNRIWIANLDGNSVTEINAANGAVVRVISGAKYQLKQPIALTYDNGAIWVVNAAGNSLTEISAADGSLVRVVSAAADHFSQPIAVAGDGTDLWVANSTGNSVTELSASDGSLVRWLSTGYSFGFPDGITAAAGHIWVASKSSCMITEVDASDGSLTGAQTLCGNNVSEGEPEGVTSDGTDVWVAEAGSKPVVTELDATAFSIVRQLGGDGDGFGFASAFPVGLTAAAGHLWVANPGSDSVTDLPQPGARTPAATAVQACVNAKSRAVTVPASGSGCPAGTTAIIWNVPGPAGPGTSSDLEPVFSGPRYHFDDPEALATDGAHVFVANAGNNSVTEVDASNGSLVRVLSDPGYGFSNPSAMAFDGTHLWVANADGNSVTEINASDGSLARIVEDPSYAFSQPSALLTEGGQLWVANRRGNSVTEINTSDASLVRTVQGPSYAFEGPGALAFDGSDIWVANGSGNTVTELSATDGTLIRNVSDGIENPQSLAFDGRHLWVGDGGFSSDIAEINASDGTSAGGSFGCARKMIFDGSHLLASCTAVFELDLGSGDLKWAPGDSGDLGDSETTDLIVAGGHLWATSSVPDSNFFIASLDEFNLPPS